MVDQKEDSGNSKNQAIEKIDGMKVSVQKESSRKKTKCLQEWCAFIVAI